MGEVKGRGKSSPPPSPKESELSVVIGNIIGDLNEGITLAFVSQTEKNIHNLEIISRMDPKSAKAILVEDEDVEIEVRENLGIDLNSIAKYVQEPDNIPDDVRTLLKVMYGIDIAEILKDKVGNEHRKGGIDSDETSIDYDRKVDSFRRSLFERLKKDLSSFIKGDRTNDELLEKIIDVVVRDVFDELDKFLREITRFERAKRSEVPSRKSSPPPDILHVIKDKIKERIAERKIKVLREVYSRGIPQVVPIQGKVVFKAYLEHETKEGPDGKKTKVKVRMPSRTDADSPEARNLSEIEIHFRLDLP